MTEWNQKIVIILKQELEGVGERDLRFFRIEEYLRMVKRVDEFDTTCKDCKQFRPEIEQQAIAIGKAIKDTGKERRDYDRHIDKLARHMKKGHGFYPPYYFTYTLSFLYALAITGFAFLLSLFFQTTDPWLFIVPGFIIGLITGQLKGAAKDAKVRAKNKLL